MKVFMKFGLLTVICGTLALGAGCRTKQEPIPSGGIGLSCQRLSACYSNYAAELKDNTVKKAVEDAQLAREESRCVVAIQQLSTAVGKECPYF